MQSTSPYTQKQDAYDEDFSELYTDPGDNNPVSLNMADDIVNKMLVQSLEADWAHWNKKPWNLSDTDETNVKFLLGDQLDSADFLKNDSRFIDNRLLASVRAILSYATGQLAKPDITPSNGNPISLKGARDIGSALYQHSLDEDMEEKVRACAMNLLSRKRAYLKLRFDPNLGLDGDITTEVVNPEDIIISRHARYLANPDKIFQRCRASIDELCARFPEKDAEIKAAYGIKRSVYSQTAKRVEYFECWFTYYDEDNMPQEGVSWFIHDKKLVLGKMKNPNWVYTGSLKTQKKANVTSVPPKPYIQFNYLNLGKSFIDETCLVEQAIPMQKMLNKRGRQIWENADYVNGRWIASKKAMSQEDATKLINKGAKTVALVETDDVGKALANVASSELPAYVYNTLLDARNEIDQMMGTPSIFKGSQPDANDTLGRDLMIKQQAGALQDDFVRAISKSMADYYKLKLQMMRVYYTDDYWFQTKGGDGKYEFILINGDKLDSNVKVSVQTDSTLPLDKATIRATAMDLWKAGNAIDYKTLMEDLGLPNPDVRAQRYLEQNTNPMQYLADLDQDQIDTEARADIDLLIMNKTPEERDEYKQAYFDYFNRYIASNEFNKLQGEKPEAAQRIVMFLAATQHAVMQSLTLQESMNPDRATMGGQAQPDMGQLDQQPQPSGVNQPNTVAGVPQMPPQGEQPMSPPVPTQ